MLQVPSMLLTRQDAGKLDYPELGAKSVLPGLSLVTDPCGAKATGISPHFCSLAVIAFSH